VQGVCPGCQRTSLASGKSFPSNPLVSKP
jgi:hypothetical protein